MRIFLTGGTGFIGQSLAQALRRRDWSVVALVRRPDSPQTGALTTMGVHYITGDVTDRQSMRAGMTGADVVIHNAGWFELGIADSARTSMHSINVNGTENVLSLALELGIPRTVYISTTAYYGDTGLEVRDETYCRTSPSRSYYEQTKTEAHDVALHYQQRGLPLITICPAHVVGPDDHSPYGYFLRMHVNGIMPPFIPSPDTVHSPVHVMDLAEGIALAAEKGQPGETYILAGESTSLRQIFETWGTHPGGMRVRFFLPFWLAIIMFASLEPVQRWLGLPAFISRETVWSNKGSRSFSSEKAQRALGWTHRPVHELWSSIMNEEHQLLATRQKRDWVSRLKPVDGD